MSEHTPNQGGITEKTEPGSDNGLRFEQQEMESLIADDTHAGQAIGQLLAVLFCVLLVLMVTATIWSIIHQNVSDDPYETPAAIKAVNH